MMSIDSSSTAPLEITGNADSAPHLFNFLKFSVPRTKKSMFEWAEKLSSNGILDRIIDIYSRYPITKINVTGDNQEEDGFWGDFLNGTLKMQEELIANGKDYYTYGNCFVTVVPPFTRYLVCPKCKAHKLHNISENENALDWEFVDFKFRGTCKNCKHKGVMKVKDEFLTGKESLKKVRIHRWSPRNITVKDMSLVGRKKIYYTLEQKYVTAIKTGDRFLVSSIPLGFIEAVKSNAKNPVVELDSDSTYHYKAESTTTPEDDGLAKPFFMSAWKDIYMTLVLRKAQECIVSEHILPMRFVYPMSDGNSSPLNHLAGDQWRRDVEMIIQKQKRDPNMIGVLSHALGYQQLGGNGRQLSISDIIEWQDRRVITMLGMPSELIYGGMQYSGMNIALRMLENFFSNYIKMQNIFLQFLVNALSNTLRVPAPAQVSLADFKMADDIAKNNAYSMLGAQFRISPTTALSGLGIDLEAEARQAEKDAPHMKTISAAYQSAQSVAAQEGNRDANVLVDSNNVQSFIRQQNAQQTMASTPNRSVVYVDPEYQRRELARIAAPERAELLRRNEAEMSPEAFANYQQQMGSNIDPQPVQKPPRRKAK